jgi:hypothetical protein
MAKAFALVFNMSSGRIEPKNPDTNFDRRSLDMPGRGK